MVKKETIIISLGGSLVAPDKIDLEFLKKFRSLILSYAGKKRFIIYVGGGKIARLYQQALMEYRADNQERDWVGIKISRLNAEVVRQTFGDLAHSEVITNPTKKLDTKKDILVGGGWKPGRSTDYGSVLLAKNSGAKTIINLTNVDYVYTKDPNKFSDAKPFKKIAWQDFIKIIGNKWSPGLSSPFDPRASKIAQKLRLKVIVINGKKLERLECFLNNKPFIGTIIYPVK